MMFWRKCNLPFAHSWQRTRPTVWGSSSACLAALVSAALFPARLVQPQELTAGDDAQDTAKRAQPQADGAEDAHSRQKGSRAQLPDAFINTIADCDATGDVRRIYEEGRLPDGTLDNVAAIHSLNPASFDAHWALYRQSILGDSPLSYAEREMVVLACARARGCDY